MNEPNTAIEFHNLTVSYQSKPALWNIDFCLPEGVLAGIIGPNGSGKSTLLKSAMGLVQPSSGYVRLFGHPLEANRQRIAYVPQRSAVDWDFPINVLDVVMLARMKPANWWKRPGREDRIIAMEALRRVQMEPFVHRQISQLSGGQQQRVFIARALAQEADLYLLDEPFAGVDAATEAAIIELLQHMRDQGKTVVVVHHDLQTVTRYFDWLAMLNTRLVAAGPMQEVFTPDSLEKTYGGRLSILTQVGEIIQRTHQPFRETPNTPT